MTWALIKIILGVLTALYPCFPLSEKHYPSIIPLISLFNLVGRQPRPQLPESYIDKIG